MYIKVTTQIVVSDEDFSVLVPEHVWTFAVMLYGISLPDRKVSQIKLLRMAFPQLGLREAKLIIEGVSQKTE